MRAAAPRMSLGRQQPWVRVQRRSVLKEARVRGLPWGPYLSERQWGTVREDYSQDGNA